MKPLNKRGNDLTGKVIGCVTVRSFFRQDGRIYWNCECTCGKLNVIEYRNLKRYPNRECKHLKKFRPTSLPLDLPADLQ